MESAVWENSQINLYVLFIYYKTIDLFIYYKSIDARYASILWSYSDRHGTVSVGRNGDFSFQRHYKLMKGLYI